MPTIPADKLQEFATALLAAGGATEEESRRVGPSLVDANLRGYESHGVMRIPYYLEATKTGEYESGVELTVLKESATHITADANWGFGQVQTGRMLERLSEKARANGMAVGTMIHCG
ncbi:MAG TPA: Ldh family oxidoreductase, partial [Pirellulaceae bacterium]|nr:Ldh family oxidoreductase [Pirellulaceae bacterium]